jgi:hypothetical protein
MTKKTATQLRLEAYLAPHADNLHENFSLKTIIEQAHLALHDACECCDTEDQINAMIDDYVNERKRYWFKVAVLIPEGVAEAAFGSNPSLKAQGELVTRYGEEAAREEAHRWKTSLGSGKPGCNPNSGTLEEAKKVIRQNDAEAPNKNPWHPKWNGKDRTAAQISVIRGMGSKVAAALARAAGTTITGQPLRK